RRHTRFSRDWSSDVCSSDPRSFSWQNSFCVLPLLFHTSINENINCRVVMSVELSIALLFSSKTIPSASSLKYVLYRWVTPPQEEIGRASCRERVKMEGE